MRPGYNGTYAFDLSTINRSIQIGTVAQPMTAGQFLLDSDPGNSITNFSLTITDDFTSNTPSVGPCSGLRAGNICGNFQATNGAKFISSMMELSAIDFDSCTNGTQSGHSCTASGGQVAANFAPNKVTFGWFFQTAIPAGAMFDIDFASWNNGAFIPQQVPEPGSLALLVGGVIGLGAMRCHRKSKSAR